MLQPKRFPAQARPVLRESCSRDNLISLQISIGAVIAKICVCPGAEPRTGRSARCNKSSRFFHSHEQHRSLSVAL